jgi:hypothetical protein
MRDGKSLSLYGDCFSISLRKRTDVNLDGVVDIRDLVILSGSYGSTPGEPKWLQAADVNGNGVVDIIDISLVIMDYGTNA